MTADLRALLADATPGVLSVEVESEPDDDVPNVYICHLETVCDQTVVREMRLGGDEPHFVEQRRKTWADMLAAAINALPALLDERDALAAEVERLRTALKRFAEACTIATHPDDFVIDDTLAATKITFGDLRSARAALSTPPKETDDGR